MYTYKKEMFPKFKFKFDGLEKIDQNYSQALQDLFVLAVLDGRRSQSFLEIGAHDASFLSNTMLLERYFGWMGVSIDIEPFVYFSFKAMNRTAKVIIGDALQLDYSKILLENFSKRVTYLSLDIEPNTNTLACLERLPLKDYRFSIITYETDYYDPNSSFETKEYVRNKSRGILLGLGYELIAGNLSNITDTFPFEDWYIDGTYFDKSVVNKFKRSSDEPLAAHKFMGLE